MSCGVIWHTMRNSQSGSSRLLGRLDSTQGFEPLKHDSAEKGSYPRTLLSKKHEEGN